MPRRTAVFVSALLFALPLAASITVVDYALPKNVPGDPMEITAGADGNVWFLAAGTDTICRIDAAGTITDYPHIRAMALTAGADGALWYVTPDHNLGRLDPYTGQSETVTSIPFIETEPDLISGPDGNLWLVNDCTNQVTRISLAGTVAVLSLPHDCPRQLARGADGNVWIRFAYGPYFVRVEPDGKTTSPAPTARSGSPSRSRCSGA